MKAVDELLIDPAPGQLVQALVRATRAANRRLKQRRVERGAAGWRRFLARVRRRPEGCRWWTGGRGGRPAAHVSAAWWTDHVGRRQWRVVGRQLLHGPHPHATPPPSDSGLWHVHPERVLLRTRDGRDDLLAFCACGACGRPDALGWAGERCGPCQDRVEEAGPATDAAAPAAPGHAHYVRCLTFLADGRLASAADDGRVRVWDPVTGGCEVAPGGAPPGHPCLAVAPDGTVAFTDGRGEVRLVGLGEGADPRSFTVEPFFTTRLRFSDDGGRLAGAGAGVFLASPAAQGVAVRGWLREWYCGPVAFGADGRTLYVVAREEDLYRIDPDGGEPTALAPDLWDFDSMPQGEWYDYYDFEVTDLKCSPDGRWLAVSAGGYGGVCVKLGHLPTGEWHDLVPGAAPDGPAPLAFTPDGGTLAVGRWGGAVDFWELPSRRPRGRLQRPAGAATPPYNSVCALAFSPDGETLAVGTQAGGVHLWPWAQLLDAV